MIFPHRLQQRRFLEQRTGAEHEHELGVESALRRNHRDPSRRFGPFFLLDFHIRQLSALITWPMPLGTMRQPTPHVVIAGVICIADIERHDLAAETSR